MTRPEDPTRSIFDAPEVDPVPVNDVDEFDPIDDEFAPRARQKLGIPTAILAAALTIGIGFAGGTYYQKNHGSTSAGAGGGAAAAAGARAGFAARAGAGGYAGAGGFGPAGGTAGGAARGGPTSTPAPSAGSTSSSDTSSIPAVIGTVDSISGLTVVVKNLGGTDVTVRMTDATTVTAKASVGGLKVGQSVAVLGTTGGDSVVTATAIDVQ
jgi:hypothetical protein